MFWDHDWAWSLPLIVATIVTHVVVLGFVTRNGLRLLHRADAHGESLVRTCVVIGAITFLATGLHALEGAVWALTYMGLGALPDGRTAMLYSFNAMTSYGHTDVYLEPRWRLMGSLQALNGIMLFGLTVGFLFAVIQGIWPLRQSAESGWRSRR